MQDLKLCLVQAIQFWEDKKANLLHFSSLLENINNVDLIVLPEMFHTGFSMNAADLAENMDGEGMKWLKQTAISINTAIYTSFIAKEDGCFYNRGVFVYPNGDVVTYDKRQCFSLAGEAEVFQSGNNETIVEYKSWKINLQICYDLRFPELIRNNLDDSNCPKYDVLLYVANWPAKRKLHWDTLLRARAIENQVYSIGVNRIGVDGNGHEYSGDSVGYSLLGEQLFLAKSESEQIMFHTLSWNDLYSWRNKLPFLKDNKIPFTR